MVANDAKKRLREINHRINFHREEIGRHQEERKRLIEEREQLRAQLNTEQGSE